MTFKLKHGLIIALTFIGLLFSLGTFEVIDRTERAVKVTVGKTSPMAYGPGFHWKLPIVSHFEVYDTTPEVVQLDITVNEKGAITTDNQTIGADSSFAWSYDGARVVEIADKFSNRDALVAIVQLTLKEAFKAEIGKYTIYQLAGNAVKIGDATRAAAVAKLKPYPVILTQFSLTNWDWDPKFDDQIQQTMAETQKVELAKQQANREFEVQRKNTIAATALANSEIAKAEGEKQAALLRAEAKRAEGQGIADYNKLIAQNLETEIKFRELENEKIKWSRFNGQLVPQYLPLTAAGGIVNLPVGDTK